MNTPDLLIGTALAVGSLLGSIAVVLRCARLERDQRAFHVSSNAITTGLDSTGTSAPSPTKGKERHAKSDGPSHEGGAGETNDGYRSSAVIVDHRPRSRVAILFARQKLRTTIARATRNAARQAVLDRRRAGEHLLGGLGRRTENQLNDVGVAAAHMTKLYPVASYDDRVIVVEASGRTEESVRVRVT